MVTLERVKRKKLSDEIIDQIVNLVKQGELKPGERLPSIPKLAELFKVSQASVREALVILERLEIIEIKPGNGTFISINQK